MICKIRSDTANIIWFHPATVGIIRPCPDQNFHISCYKMSKSNNSYDLWIFDYVKSKSS